MNENIEDVLDKNHLYRSDYADRHYFYTSVDNSFDYLYIFKNGVKYIMRCVDKFCTNEEYMTGFVDCIVCVGYITDDYPHLRRKAYDHILKKHEYFMPSHSPDIIPIFRKHVKKGDTLKTFYVSTRKLTMFTEYNIITMKLECFDPYMLDHILGE